MLINDSIFIIPEEIDKTVNKIYNDKFLYEKISSSGYERFIKNHTSEAVGQRFIKICKEAIQNTNE